ncbi:uncharacterized protein LOC129234194 isoform X1 [Uloborus diversus]|uniref:uncharacterized protein LOC129234194 isoform X1 n=1 Tax=Uloborus diversus TaxID=327109 RepID=UPI0024090C8D|nr:uncharacterized protein LOC129234194 isoform X1 [Uloborus diversus]XP_054724084.1 uncharacterized protein LOC129234194 isoform X1 [Uloborus diversus]XP_054724085.1 uncharacterized protein LOC129234194 isoform X1 [Uloborus diversus]
MPNQYGKTGYCTVEISKSSSGKKVSYAASIGSAILYGICSTSMAFTNKAVITSFNFDFPFFIMACQMMICMTFLEVLRILNIINVPKYSFQTGKSFAWPSFFYALHSITALHALGGMSVPMYAAVKRCAPIVTLALSVIMMKKETPKFRVVFAVVFISVGCILASIGDLKFDIQAYGYGAISVLVQGLYLTLSEKCLENLSTLHVLYINSFNTIPFFVIMSFVLEAQEITIAEKFSDCAFLLCFGIQTCMGALLNYSLFLCTAKNSAVTTSLVGVLKSVLQTLIGLFTFGGVELNVMTIFGLSLNLFGGILYSYSKYIEKYSVSYSNIKPI